MMMTSLLPAQMPQKVRGGGSTSCCWLLLTLIVTVSMCGGSGVHASSKMAPPEGYVHATVDDTIEPYDAASAYKQFQQQMATFMQQQKQPGTGQPRYPPPPPMPQYGGLQQHHMPPPPPPPPSAYFQQQQQQQPQHYQQPPPPPGYQGQHMPPPPPHYYQQQQQQYYQPPPPPQYQYQYQQQQQPPPPPPPSAAAAVGTGTKLSPDRMNIIDELQQHPEGEHPFMFYTEDRNLTGPLEAINYNQWIEDGGTALQKVQIEWLVRHGTQHRGKSYLARRGRTGVGMLTSEPTTKGELFFAVPVHLMIYAYSPRMSRKTQQAVNYFRTHFRVPGWPRRDLDLTEMGLIVYMERKDPNSFWAPYLSLLQPPDCPAFYGPEELEAFQGSYIVKWRTHFLRRSFKLFDKCLENEQFMQRFVPGFSTREREIEEFLWAVSTVLQRSFAWGPGDRRDYVMVPYMDMINHKFLVRNRYHYGHMPIEKLRGAAVRDYYEDTPDGMVKMMRLEADKNYTTNEEIFITYNDYSNSVQLLIQYGFVVPNNTHDYLLLELEFPDVDNISTSVFNEAATPVKNVSEAVISFIKSKKMFVKVPVWRNGSLSHELLKTGAYLMTLKESAVADAEAFLSGGSDETSRLRGQAMVVHLLTHVIEGCNKHLQNFTTTLEQDEQLLNNKAITQVMNRNMYAAVAFRVEVKRYITEVMASVARALTAASEGRPPPNDVTPEDRRDWPLAVINVAYESQVGVQV